jgi:ABC-type multidrug transport system permease subunit
VNLADRPLVQLTLGRAREMWREPGVVFWVFGFPILLAVALGLAFRNRPPEELVVAVVDAGDRAAVESAAAAIDAVDEVRAEIVSAAEASERLRSGRASIVLHPGAAPRITLDPSRPGSLFAKTMVHDALERARGRVDLLELIEERVEAPGRRYIDFLLPGLLGMNLMSGGVWGVGWALVLMRTRKLLKRFAATPMKRSDLLLSFMLFRVLIALVEGAFLVLFGGVAFGLWPSGDLLSIAGLVVLSALCFAGVGLLIAARSQNAQTAAGLMNLVTLPMFLLSGVFFPATNFPDWMQPAVKALPLTSLNDALRAVMLDGASLAALPLEAGILAGWCVASFVVALRIFRWT